VRSQRRRARLRSKWGVTEGELDKIKDRRNREIRAEVISALCTGEVPGWTVHPRAGLQLRGAKIVGRIDLTRAQLSKCPLAFHACRFEESVSLSQATIADVAFTSCDLPGLFGDQLSSAAR